MSIGEKALSKEAENRVLMTKRLAHRWVLKHIKPEHRLIVYYGARDISRIPSLLRSFRDNKVFLDGVPQIADLGVTERFDCFEIWSEDKEGMVALDKWLSDRGFETSGVW